MELGGIENLAVWQEDIFRLNRPREEKKEERERRVILLRRDYDLTFGSPHGERVFWDLMEVGYAFVPFGAQNASAYAKEGKRELSLYIMAMRGFSPDPEQFRRLTLSMATAYQSAQGEKR